MREISLLDVDRREVKEVAYGTPVAWRRDCRGPLRGDPWWSLGVTESEALANSTVIATVGGAVYRTVPLYEHPFEEGR
jgi:hypothetical protein